jgi:hypothetical protein
MKRILFPAFLFLFLAACSSKTASNGTSDTSVPGGAVIAISAAPRQGFAPLRVTLRGELRGVDENNEEYYCLQEEWDFGDGAKSTEKPNCDPYSPDTKVKAEFFADHVYEKHGNYTVRLVLGEKKLRSRQITVSVIERDRGYPGH